MPLTTVKDNTRKRFAEVLVNLNFIATIEPEGDSPLHVKIMRGQFYVHLYGAFEKTINETVERTLLVINAKEINNQHFNMAFNSISQYPKMQGFKMCNNKDFFKRSAEIFNLIESNTTHKINDTVFSNTLQNVWHETIQEIVICFGMPTIDFGARARTTIDEIVNNRNAVAHGREAPSTIGERHQVDILRTKLDEINQVAESFINAFDVYISTGGFLREECKKLHGFV